MKKKLIGIFVCMLLIATALPITSIMAVETEKESESSLNVKQNKPILSLLIFAGNYSGFGTEKRLGCYGEVWNPGDENITFNVSFNVKSYSFQGEYLGESSEYRNDFTLFPDTGTPLRIIPDYYGEIFTWVKATLEVELKESEETNSKIGLSIGKWIHFFYLFNIKFIQI